MLLLASTRRGILPQRRGIFTQRRGNLPQRRGIFTQRRDNFTQRRGIFTQHRGNFTLLIAAETFLQGRKTVTDTEVSTTSTKGGWYNHGRQSKRRHRKI